jgi:hypothetical protein
MRYGMPTKETWIQLKDSISIMNISFLMFEDDADVTLSSLPPYMTQKFSGSK